MNKENGTTSFIFMGDPQCSRISGRDSDYAGWEALLERALEEMRCDGSSSRDKPLLVLGGDIVNRGNRNREEEWTAFFEAQETAVSAAGISSGLLMATPVNGAEESAGIYANRFINTGNGPVGHEKEFFSFDYGCCHFLFLDSDYMGNSRRDAYKFIGAWIRSDLAVNRKPVVFAVMHHPAFTVGTSYEDDVRAAVMRENYMSLLYRYGVDFILCGHQHVYARTKPADDVGQVTQIMGVSGTKYFGASDKGSMAAISEYVSVATLFETDGETVNLRTIDRDGLVLDEYVQQARPMKKRKCATCEKFNECGGTGTFEKLEAEEKALKFGDPLKPANKEGIVVLADTKDADGVHKSNCVLFNDEELSGFGRIEVEYSVMRRGRLEFETKRGFRLSVILEKAGMTAEQTADKDAVLILTDSKGRQKMLPLNAVLNGMCFRAERNVVPAIIFTEEEEYRLAYGQQEAAQYNGRGWMRDVRQIEIR